MGKYGLLTQRDSPEQDKSKAPRCYTFRGFTFIRLGDSTERDSSERLVTSNRSSTYNWLFSYSLKKSFSLTTGLIPGTHFTKAILNCSIISLVLISLCTLNNAAS